VRRILEGFYRNGRVELTEVPSDVCDGARVLVTFLKPQDIDLRTRGIDEAHAAELRTRLATFAEDWTVPRWPFTMTTMPPKPVYKRGEVILTLSPHADLRMAKLRLDLIVQANDLRTGLPQVAVAMITSRLFRENHLS
jgi:hypothetical protein